MEVKKGKGDEKNVLLEELPDWVAVASLEPLEPPVAWLPALVAEAGKKWLLKQRAWHWL